MSCSFQIQLYLGEASHNTKHAAPCRDVFHLAISDGYLNLWTNFSQALYWSSTTSLFSSYSLDWKRKTDGKGERGGAGGLEHPCSCFSSPLLLFYPGRGTRMSSEGKLEYGGECPPHLLPEATGSVSLMGEPALVIQQNMTSINR